MGMGMVGKYFRKGDTLHIQPSLSMIQPIKHSMLVLARYTWFVSWYLHTWCSKPSSPTHN